MSFATVILAAGKGTRMKSDIPKVMHEIAHKPLINWIIDATRAANSDKILTVISQDFDNNLDSQLVFQKQRLGTGHAVKQCKDKLSNYQGKVIILVGDAPLIKPNTITKLVDKLDECDLAVAGIELDNPTGYGRLILKNNKLTGIIEQKDASPDQLKINSVNSGIIAVSSAKLLFELLDQINDNNAQKEYYLTDIISIANNKNYNCGHVIVDKNEVIGINSQADLAKVENIAQDILRRKHLDNGVKLLDPKSVYFAYDTNIQNNVTIEPNVFLGKKVEIKSGCHIKAFSHIEGSIIGNDCMIGPFARLRNGTVIKNEVKIGNFVETKKAIFNNNAKASHLSYLGDCNIGENANIGAGCITCNYDGYDKFNTKIGDNAFIGSNTAMVAPVNIGENAIIGAGSTITKNVEPDSLALSRAKTIVKKNWARVFRNKKSKT